MIVQGVTGEYGLLVVEPGAEGVGEESFCLIYYPVLYTVAVNRTTATRYRLAALKVSQRGRYRYDLCKHIYTYI